MFCPDCTVVSVYAVLETKDALIFEYAPEVVPRYTL